MDIPRFLFTFANDRQGRLLRGIAHERDAVVQRVIKQRRSHCDLIEWSAIKPHILVDELRKNPTVWHYAGHAQSDCLVFDSHNNIKVDGQLLSGLLTANHGMELVFLNGCSTRDHADDLLEAGIQHVIVTDRRISDDAAVIFAQEFYRGLLDGHNVTDAFMQAENSTQILVSGRSNRGPALRLWDGDHDENELPWLLKSSPAREKDPWTWKEPCEEAYGKVVKEDINGSPLRDVLVSAGKEVEMQTDEMGKFPFTIGCNMLGKRLKIDVVKPDYTVVNSEALNIFLDTERKHDEYLTNVVMCAQGMRDHFAAKYYGIGIEKTKNSADRDSSREVQEQVAALQRQIVKHCVVVSVVDAPESYARARQYVLEGNIDDALKTLEEARLADYHDNVKRARDYVAHAYALKAGLHVLKHDFKTAKECYANAAATNPFDINAWLDYFNFLYTQHDFDDAENTCDHRLRLFAGPDLQSRANRASVLHNLGRLYLKRGFYQKSIDCYQEALKLREQFVETASVTERNHYRGQVAATLDNLGEAYRVRDQLAQAEKYLKQALELTLELEILNPSKYRRFAAAVYKHLGLVYTHWQDHGSPEEMYSASIRRYRDLTQEEPQTYCAELARALTHKGKLLNIDDDSISGCLEAEGIYAGLFQHNPRRYQAPYSLALHTLGRLYHKMGRCDRAQDYFEHALKLRRALYTHDKTAFSDELAATQVNLGLLFMTIQEYDRALTLFKEAHRINAFLFNLDQQAYTHFYVYGLIYLAEAHMALDQLKEAKPYLLAARESAPDLSNRDRGVFKFKRMEQRIRDTLRRIEAS